MTFCEASVSRNIIKSYSRKLEAAVTGDVAIVGAGPSGLVAAWRLAEKGFRVSIFEKRLAPGGGVWGGAMGMNEIVVQPEAFGLLRTARVRYRMGEDGLGVVDAAELASALCLKALQEGAAYFNLMAVEDVVVKKKRVAGVVVNRTLIGENLPVDPLVFSARAVLDATGHEAAVLNFLRKRGLFKERKWGEDPMDAPAGEAFVQAKAGEVYPGLYVAGMSVCTAYGGPRMGPIFGGMLLSGERAAGRIAADLRKPSAREERSK
jgi:thiamine thiazole synthase